MEPLLILLICSVIGGFTLLFLFIRRELHANQKPQDQAVLLDWLRSMQNTVNATNSLLNQTMRGSTSDMTKAMQENSRQINERLDAAAQVIGDLKQNLGEMSEVGRGIRSLQEFLQSPKLRGNIGEQVLSDMIGQTFPKNSFFLQHQFRSGVKVDAVLKTDAGLLCIDSKFPMEQFGNLMNGETEKIRSEAKKAFIQDVKKHILDISRKYILPEEETMDFALMYIPSEAVYYEIATMNELMTLAQKYRVYPVSPNTLYAHLQVLLLSFQGKEMEKKSQEVFRMLRAMKKDYETIEDQLGVLNRHVTNAYNSMGTVTSGFGLLRQRFAATTMIEGELHSQQESG